MQQDHIAIALSSAGVKRLLTEFEAPIVNWKANTDGINWHIVVFIMLAIILFPCGNFTIPLYFSLHSCLQLKCNVS